MVDRSVRAYDSGSHSPHLLKVLSLRCSKLMPEEKPEERRRRRAEARRREEPTKESNLAEKKGLVMGGCGGVYRCC